MKINNENILFILLAILIYLLDEKFISILTQQYIQSDLYVQKKFTLKLISGLTLILIGLSVFNDGTMLSNRIIKNAFCYGGAFVLITGSIFNWHKISDGTKIIILSLITFLCMMYSYNII